MNEEESKELNRKVDQILILLRGDEFGQQGLVHRVSDVEKKILQMDRIYAKMIGAGAVFLFLFDLIYRWFFKL